MKLSELQPTAGSSHRRLRLGRGHGSGKVKTSGRGQKGQKSRAGSKVPAYFEGGQMRLAQRLPVLRGFNNPFRKEFATVNVADLEDWDGESEVNPESLAEQRLIRGNEADGLVKILGDGELSRKLTVRAHKFTATARAKIEAAGGTIIEIPMKSTVQTKRGKADQAPAKSK
jgi:large subunit ribosomal protein L15